MFESEGGVRDRSIGLPRSLLLREQELKTKSSIRRSRDRLRIWRIGDGAVACLTECEKDVVCLTWEDTLTLGEETSLIC